MPQSAVGRMPSILARSRRVLQNHETVWVWLQLWLDMMVVSAALWGERWWTAGPFDTHYRVLLVMTLLLMGGLYSVGGVHRRFGSVVCNAFRLARAWGSVLMALAVIGVVTDTLSLFSQRNLLVWAVAALLGQWLVNGAIYLLTRYRQQQGHHYQPALVVGTQPLARYLVSHINRNSWLPEQVIGVVAQRQAELASWTSAEETPVLGTLDDLPALVERLGIRRVYIALPLKASAQIETVYLKLMDKNLDIIWAPDIFGLNLLNLNVKEVAGVPLLSLCETPLTGMPALLKLLLDKLVSLLALVLLSPLMVLTALAVKLTSRGPVLFKQQRHGWDGRVIEVWKFRSMRVHQEGRGVVTQAKRKDPRLTPIGGFLRRTSLDELPQLFNVLQGTMSLVGPRPHAIEHNDYYSDKIKAYFVRHRIKPGITGLAQVNGCRGETETLDKMQQRVAYDLTYINNWSLWLDISILVKTVFTLFSKNAY